MQFSGKQLQKNHAPFSFACVCLRFVHMLLTFGLCKWGGALLVRARVLGICLLFRIFQPGKQVITHVDKATVFNASMLLLEGPIQDRILRKNIMIIAQLDHLQVQALVHKI